MNLGKIESQLTGRLKRLLGRSVQVIAAPATAPVLGGMRPTVYVHASKFEDFGGITATGAHIARTRVSQPPFNGFAEKRPSRIIIHISCLAASYATVQKLCSSITPMVLLTLETLPEIPVGASKNNSVRLSYDDFTACLNAAEFKRQQEQDFAVFCGQLVFYLEGFLHLVLTKRGRMRPLAAQRKPTSKTKPAKITPARAKQAGKPAKTKRTA